VCRMHSARNEQPLRSWGAAGLWPARPRAQPFQLAILIVSSLCTLGRWSELACTVGVWLAECADEPSGARRFFFSVYRCTLCRHKKALQGVNLTGLVGVEGGGLNAVIFFYCCAEDFSMVRFEACDKVSHCLRGGGFICSKL